MLFILLDAREPVFWIISLPWCSVLSPGLNPIYHDYARCIHCGLCPEYLPDLPAMESRSGFATRPDSPDDPCGAKRLSKVFGLAERELLLPRLDSHFFYDRIGKTFPAVGERRARVAFFAG